MSNFDDIVAIVEYHRRRWKCFPSLTISLTKSLRVAGSLKGHCIEFKYYADGIHSGLTPPGNNS